MQQINSITGTDWEKHQQESAGTELERFFGRLASHNYPFYDRSGAHLHTAGEVRAAGTARTVYSFCPVHETAGGHDPSLSIDIKVEGGGERVLTYCHACGENPWPVIFSHQLPVCNAHRVERESDSSGNAGSKLVAGIELDPDGWDLADLEFRWKMQQDDGIDDRTYFYGDQFAKVKWTGVNGTRLKAYAWYRREGQVWRRGLNRQVAPLYAANLDKPGPVWCVEGEKDVESLAALGLPAVSTVFAGGVPDLSVLAGRDLIIVPDNDGHGRDEAAKFTRSVVGVAGAVQRVEWPEGTPDKWDVSDYLDGGGTAEGLTELAMRVTEPQQERRSNRLVSGGSFFLDLPGDIPAIWGEGERVYWAQGEGMMIVAGQGLGKTTIGQQLMLHLLGLRKEKFLGFPVTVTDKKILYLAMDRPQQAARSGHRMVTDDDRPVLDDRVVIWKGPLPVNVLESPDIFADWAESTCPGIGVILGDSVKDFCPGLSKDEVGSALNLAWQEVIARDIEICLLHHERKAGNGQDRENVLDSVYGSTWLTSGLGSVLMLAGEAGGERVTMLHLKQPADRIEDALLEHNRATGRTRLITRETTAFEVLRNAGELTTREIAEQLYGSTPDGRMIEQVKRELRHLVTLEIVVRIPGRSLGRGHGREPDRWRLVEGAQWTG